MPDDAKRTGYRDVADELRRRIIVGELPPGAPVPSEKQIREEFGVTRVTAGRALDVLRNEGLIYTLPRRGSTVRHQGPTRTLSLDRYKSGPVAVPASGSGPFSDYSIDRTFSTEEATPHVADSLGLPDGSSVLHRRYVLRLFGMPQQITDSFMPLDLVGGTPLAGLDTEPEPYGNTVTQLATLDVRVTKVVETVRARMPLDAEETALLIPSGVPVVTITRQMYAGERIVEAAVDIVVPADRVNLRYSIDL